MNPRQVPAASAGQRPLPGAVRSSPPRRLLRGALWLVLAPLLLIAGLVFIVDRTVNLQWAAEQVVRLTDGRLQVHGLTGSVLGEMAADSIRWEGESGLVTLTSPRFAYHPSALLDGLIRVERISADDVQVELPPASASPEQQEPSGPAVRLPQALSAVLPVAIERIDARRVVVRRDGLELASLHNLDAVVRHDGDRVNARLLNLDVGSGAPSGSGIAVRGEVTVLSRAPHATDGRLLVQPGSDAQPGQPQAANLQSSGAQPLRAEVRINGPLEELSVRAVTTVGGAPLEARMVLYPFDSRPLRQVRLDLKDLDLSHLDPTLPVTRFTGSYEAEIKPAWANESKPLLIGPLTLVNSVAGPLDRGLVPVAAAKAVARYASGRVELQGLEATGTIGEVAGDGSIGPDGLRLRLASEHLLLRGLASTLAPRMLTARISIEPAAAGAGAGAGGGAGTGAGEGRGAEAGTDATKGSLGEAGADGWDALMIAGAAIRNGGMFGSGGALNLEMAASDASLTARVKGVLSPGRLQVREAQVHAGPKGPGPTGRVAFEGEVGTSTPWPVDLSGNVRNLDLDPVQAYGLPPALLNGTWRLAGPAGGSQGGVFQTEVTLADSRLRGLPLAGRFAARVGIGREAPPRVSGVEGAFRWGSGTLAASGALGAPSDALRLALELPKADEVQDGVSGRLVARATLRGALRSPALEATVEATDLAAASGGILTRMAGAVLEVRSEQAQTGLLNLQAWLDGVEVVPVVGGIPAAGGVLSFDRVVATLDGSAAEHRASLSAVGKDQRRLTLSAEGGVAADGRWRGMVDKLSASHPLLKLHGAAGSVPVVGGAGGPIRDPDEEGQDLRLRRPFAVVAGAGRVGARAASFDLHGAIVNLKLADWRDSELTLSAEASSLESGWLRRFVSPGVLHDPGAGADDVAARAGQPSQDLRIAAKVDFTGNLADASAAGWRGRLELKRESGDLALSGRDGSGTIPAGVRTLQASAVLDTRVLHVVVNADGENIGQVTGEAQASLRHPAAPAWSAASLASTTLEGRIDLATSSFRWITPLAGGSWLLDGDLSAHLQLAGTLGRPRVEGFVSGSNLSARAQALGMRLSNGVLAAEVDGGRVDVKVLRFESGEGSVAISGLLQAPGNGGSEAHVVIDRLPVMLGPDERVVLSGSAGATLGKAALDITGRLAVDEGTIQLKEGGAPASDDLVFEDDLARRVLVREAPDDPAAAVHMTGVLAGSSAGNGSRRRIDAAVDAGRVEARTATSGPGPGAEAFSIGTDLEIDLGRRFRVTGSGLESHLRGAIRLRGSFPERPSAVGTVELVGGSYLVLGRKLKLRQGRVIFHGLLDQPALDIVAIREHPVIETGLTISGTAAAPAVSLISEPLVGDADKLAWLVLGTGLHEARRAGQLLVLRNAATTLFGEQAAGIAHEGIAQDGTGAAGTGQAGSGQAGPGQAGPGPGQAGSGQAFLGQAPGRSQGMVAALSRKLSSSLALTCEESLRGVWDILRLQSEITDRLSSSARSGSDRLADLLGSLASD